MSEFEGPIVEKEDKPFSLRNRRILLSQCFMALLGAVIMFSGSQWESVHIAGDIFFLSGITLAAIAVVGRLWCSVYISGYKINTLVITGPYSMCRNPLYFFSLLGATGVGLTTETLVIPLIMFIVFLLYYPHIIRKEEKRLLAVHQETYAKYCEKTPRFIPSFSSFDEPEEYTIKPIVFRRRLFDSLWFIWIIGIIKLIQGLHESSLLPVLFRLY